MHHSARSVVSIIVVAGALVVAVAAVRWAQAVGGQGDPPVGSMVASAATTSGSAAAPPPRGSFSTVGIMPREATGAAEFLRRYPEYDGRGVIVAIFDTGVDPGAPGMQITSDGKPKIIDVVDGTGSGDVDTSTVLEARDGVLAGLSGRSLKLDPAWSNPTGKWHVGMKRAFELYPGELVQRLVEKRRRAWDERQRAAVTAVERQRAALDASDRPSDPEAKKQREELDARLKALGELQEKYEDPGPIFDCVVWHDGQTWRVVIDADEDGELAEEKVLTNFRLERQHGTFSSEDLMNYAVNVYDDGKLLSIVTDSGAHGTHVAGIVAAHFPDQPELSGVAPGAQIVSVKIGDTRLGSTSTGQGEVRGLVAVLENGCDLINMSYGGPTADPDRGRTTELYSRIVNKHNVIFVASAGNEGPALTTAGGPGATTEALFGVGAYVAPDMMSVLYSMRQTVPPTQFTWSSRGPTTDGALGVKFSAPGAAISPVPNHELQRNAMMNGTSMAAPNACGNIALLLSGLKAQQVGWSPARVRRALENTAVAVEGIEVFALGRGLIQAPQAFEYLIKHKDLPDQDVRFEARIPARGNARGLYLREPFETDRPAEVRVVVTPVFHEDAPNIDKVHFELRCNVESTARWVEVGSQLMLMHDGRRLDIRVDPTGLPPGAHYAEIRGYDATGPQRGPLFRLPITVIRPLRLESGAPTWSERMSFRPGQIERRFIAVPDGATWADVRLRRQDNEEPRLVLLHAVQLLPGEHYAQNELKEYVTLGPQAQEIRSLKVTGGRTLELCLAQFWSSLGEAQVDAELTFHGVLPDNQRIVLDGAELVTPVGLTSPLGPQRVAPKGSLDTLRQTLRPTSFEIRPLDGRRDLLPESRQMFELVLEYGFKLDEKSKVTPRPALSEVQEYEETWQGQIYMIFDSVKRWIATGTSDPKPVTLDKGDYVIRYFTRLDNRDELEKLKDMPLLLDRALEKPVSLRVLSDPDDVFGDGRFASRVLLPGARATVYLAGPESDKLPKAAQAGDLLLGSIKFGAADEKLPGEGERPGGYPVVYRVPPKPADKKKGGKDDAPEDKPLAQRVAEALRDAKVAQLGKLHDPNEAPLFEKLLAEVLAEHPGHLPALLEDLKRADKHREKDMRAVVAAADRVVAAIDTRALAEHFGTNIDPDDTEAAKLRKEMDERKAALCTALHLKARALYDLAGKEEPGSDARATADTAFEAAFGELEKWTDTTADDYVALHIDRLTRIGRPGQALKLLNKRIADGKPDRKLFEQRITLFEKLGWEHWQRYEQAWLLIRFPRDYPPL